MKTRALLLSFLLLGSLAPAPAREGQPAKAVKSTTAGKASSVPLGLDPATLKLVNRGDWQDAARRLETLNGQRGASQRTRAWLAFSYMFLGRCDDLAKIADSTGGQKESSVNDTLVASFQELCKGKLDDAQKRLEELASEADADPLVAFALAAVAGKRGQAANAIVYCEKTVSLAPEFGWALRTLGYLQERWLKDPQRAEGYYLEALAIEPDFKEVRDMLVDLYLTKNNFDAAIDVAQAGIKSNPQKSGSYFRLAQIYIQQWRLREAIVQLEKAIALDGADARFHRAKADILRHQGHLNAAIAEQQKAVELSKDKTFELVDLASLNIAAGNNNKAADNLREALKLDPNNQAAYQKLVQILEQEKRYSDLADEYKKALERNPKEVSIRLSLARALKAAGKAEDAERELKEAAQLTEVDPVPHRELGALYVERKDFSAAAKSYTRALNINPSSVSDLVALGFCYASDEEYLRAETALVTAIALQQLTQLTGKPGQGSLNDVMRSLAVLFIAEGRYSEACTQLEAICASPRAPLSDLFLLAEAKSLRDRTGSAAKGLEAAFEKLSDAEKTDQKVVLIDTLIKSGQVDRAMVILAAEPEQKSPPGLQSLITKSRAYRLKGDLKKAQEYASQAAALEGEDADKKSEAILERGLVAFALANLADADNDIRKAIELNPKSFAAYEASGRIYMARKDPQHALEAAKKSLEINPYYTQAHMLSGDALSASGKLKEASASYKRAADLYPGLIDAHKALLGTYEKLSMKDEAKSEADQVAQIEKRE